MNKSQSNKDFDQNNQSNHDIYILKKKIICLDTETTGFSNEFDRIVEIGCVDITHGWENKTHFQAYINPNRSVPAAVVAIHGLTEEFLKDFSTFDKYIESFLAFIKDATLIIHNARFDIGFLNAELQRYNYPILTNEVIDSVEVAKKLFPGKKVNLNALKEHFQINIAREYHGALLDAEILAQVYIAMQTTQTTLNTQSNEEDFEKTIVLPSEKLITLDENDSTLHNAILNSL